MNMINKKYIAIKSYLPAVIVILILLFGGNLLASGFSSLNNIGNLVSMASITAIAASAQLLVVVVGGESIDLSIGPTMSLAALMLPHLTEGENIKLIPVILFLLLIGGSIGLINGMGSQIIGIPPLIMTMIMGTVVNGVTFAWTKGLPLLTLPSGIRFVGTQIIGTFCGIVFVIVILVIALEYILRRRRFGQSLYLIGSNRNAARMAGLRIRRNVVLAYLFAGIIAAAGGIAAMGYLGIGNMKMCENYTMLSVASLAIGGANMQGGRGTVIGSVIGAVVLQLLSSVLVAAGWNQGIRQLIQGLVLVLILVAIFVKNAKKLQQ